MVTLREEIALKRVQIDAEKKAIASLKATNQDLVEEKTAYEEDQNRLRQELAELDAELDEARGETAVLQQKADELLGERKDWDPEYLARLAPITVDPPVARSVGSGPTLDRSPSGIASSQTGTSPGGQRATQRPFSDANSGHNLPDVSRPGPSVGSASLISARNPLVDLDVELSGAGSQFDDDYTIFNQSAEDDYNFDQVDDGNIFGPDFGNSLSGDPSGDSLVSPPVYGLSSQPTIWNPKYLAASADAQQFVLTLPVGLTKDGNGLYARDFARTDPIFDYDWSEHRNVFLSGWDPDTLDDDVFASHSDEAHQIKALEACKDETMARIDTACRLRSGLGHNKDCCPRIQGGLPLFKVIVYECPDPACKFKRKSWALLHTDWRPCVVCRGSSTTRCVYPLRQAP